MVLVEWEGKTKTSLINILNLKTLICKGSFSSNSKFYRLFKSIKNFWIFWTIWRERTILVSDNVEISADRMRSSVLCDLWYWTNVYSIDSHSSLIDFNLVGLLMDGLWAYLRVGGLFFVFPLSLCFFLRALFVYFQYTLGILGASLFCLIYFAFTHQK